jgi:hypothetical protein
MRKRGCPLPRPCPHRMDMLVAARDPLAYASGFQGGQSTGAELTKRSSSRGHCPRSPSFGASRVAAKRVVGVGVLPCGRGVSSFGV